MKLVPWFLARVDAAPEAVGASAGVDVPAARSCLSFQHFGDRIGVVWYDYWTIA